MIRVRRTVAYRDWINGLRDHQSRARIQVRVDRLAHGNPGSHRALRDGELIILLAGGDKGTQNRDIKTALTLARNL